MEFDVRPQKLKDISTNIDNISRDIKNAATDIRTTAQLLKSPDPGMDQIIRHIKTIAGSVDNQVIIMNKMSQVLMSAAQQYITTENMVAGSASGIRTAVENEASHALPKRDDLPKRIQDYLDSIDWSKVTSLDVIISVLQFMFPGIALPVLWIVARTYIKNHQDSLHFQDTHQTYTDKVEKMYDNASGRAKDVYDKYKKDVKIEEIPDPTDPNKKKPVSHYSPGSNTLYINMDDMNDRRGPASVYYHEYGHYVVDQMGWIKSDGSLSPEFQCFQNAVQRDVQQFVDNIENTKRAEYQSMGYTGKQLETMVQKGTQQELSRILGGENTHVLDGVSDMIDAQTNSKYQITYAHPIRDNGGTYWDQDPTLQPNEAFAEMFSADFCSDDQAEIDFIKEHFPNAYREYQNLLESAAK